MVSLRSPVEFPEKGIYDNTLSRRREFYSGKSLVPYGSFYAYHHGACPDLPEKFKVSQKVSTPEKAPSARMDGVVAEYPSEETTEATSPQAKTTCNSTGEDTMQLPKNPMILAASATTMTATVTTFQFITHGSSRSTKHQVRVITKRLGDDGRVQHWFVLMDVLAAMGNTPRPSVAKDLLEQRLGD
jgi:hypothetical protein